MKTLKLFKIETIDHIITPEDFKETTIDSPALSIFTDFKYHRALVIEASTKAVEAQLLMQKAHVNLKLVLSEENRICGIVSNKDVSDQELIKLVTLGDTRENILVTDVMQPRDSLKALDYCELSNSTVRQVIKTLENNDLQHCLVVEHSQHEIRGLISSSDIARKLHIAVSFHVSPTFADIFSAIHS